MDKFTERFRDLMYETNSSYSKIADGMDVDRRSLYHWMKGENVVNSTNIIKICNYFHVSADWLLGLSDERERK